jgi:hypothetical protein
MAVLDPHYFSFPKPETHQNGAALQHYYWKSEEIRDKRMKIWRFSMGYLIRKRLINATFGQLHSRPILNQVVFHPVIKMSFKKHQVN